LTDFGSKVFSSGIFSRSYRYLRTNLTEEVGDLKIVDPADVDGKS